jgi:5-methylcytosine-specific restriction endonuclease McrA
MTPVMYLCPGCSRLTNRGGRCTSCMRQPNRERNARRRDGGHTDPAWQRLSRTVLTAWRAKYGDLCPGDEHHPPHPCTDLTVDHIHPLSKGSSLTDQANLRVLCRSANSAKAAR